MKTNAMSLAMRDPAMAALMGAISAGSFGREADFGNDFSADMSADMYGDFGDVGGDFGDVGGDFGDGGMYGDFGAARARKPHPAAMARMAAAHVHKQGKTQRRKSILNPNAGSDVKVEGYSFTVPVLVSPGGTVPVLGTASSLSGNNTPDTYFRPQRASINVNVPGLIFVNNITIGNVNGTVGGVGDAFDYSPLAQGISLSLPLMSPSTKATFQGSFTTFIPPGYVLGNSYTVALSFKGPATMDPGM